MAWLFLIAVPLILVLILNRVFRGADLSYLDPEPQDPTPLDREASQPVLERLKQLERSLRGLKGKARLQQTRKALDHLNDDAPVNSEFRPVDEPVGEWVVAPGADPDYRILYIHGGAWMAGSPRSHRALTDRLSQRCGAAVFAVDYRLMPENRYLDGLTDCKRTYQWLLNQGPDGAAPAKTIAIAGDSAGGTLSLVLSQWIRDQGLMSPRGVVSLCPATDMTFSAPSLKSHVRTDPMLGPIFGQLTRFPAALIRWTTFLLMRRSPASPLLSPVRDDLTDLPPTLIQVSSSEMLFDDARRFARKAVEAGSPVQLTVWPGMVHVWHLFPHLLDDAETALEDIAAFLATPQSPV